MGTDLSLPLAENKLQWAVRQSRCMCFFAAVSRGFYFVLGTSQEDSGIPAGPDSL
jgi:hypothetical protein